MRVFILSARHYGTKEYVGIHQLVKTLDDIYCSFDRAQETHTPVITFYIYDLKLVYLINQLYQDYKTNKLTNFRGNR